jgi:UDP-4-amino-4,6-dideoxy-N-acetyl-beta-L-altrosamine N-acetyltransferase
MHDAVGLRPVLIDDLPILRTWRNHASVRAMMFSQHQLAEEEHRAWYLRVCQDPTRRLLLAEDATGPFGFVQFADVAPGGVADWGFYIRPGAIRGSGTRLCSAALEHAFSALDLHKVCGQVIVGNSASVALHHKLGFAEEGVLRDQKFINGGYLSLVCFGMLKPEWIVMRNRRPV